MAFFDRLMRRYSPKIVRIAKVATRPASRQLPSDEFSQLYADGLAIEPVYDPTRLLILAETNEIHAACLAAKAADTVGRGWTFDPTSDEADDEERSCVEKALQAACGVYTFQELLHQAAWERFALGWSAWEVIRDEAGQIAALYPVPAHTIRATRDPDKFVQVRDARVAYFKRFGVDARLSRSTGRWGDVPPEDEASELLTFQAYSPRSSFYGIPDFIAALPAMAEYAAIRDYNVAFFETAGVLSRILLLASDKSLGPLIEEIEATVREAQGRAHSVLVAELPEGTEVHDIRLSPDVREGHFARRREDLVKAILIAHNVPPFRVGWAVVGSLGGSAAREMLDAYLHGTIEPAQTLMEHRLNQTLFGPSGFGLQGWRFKLADLSIEESDFTLRRVIQSVSTGLLTPNEGRKELGYQPADDPIMDEHYVGGRPLGMTAVAARVGSGADELVGVARDLRAAIRAALGQEASNGVNVNGRHPAA